MREARASRQFNRLWQPRTAMQLAASLWLVGPWLQGARFLSAAFGLVSGPCYNQISESTH